MEQRVELMSVKKSAISALVLAETISVLGTRMTYLALPWFVLVTTGSASKMSLVLAAEILPMAILGIPSGALVQRLGSRTTMLAADLARAPILVSIPILHSAGLLDFGLLLAIVALLGAFAPPYFAAQRTILPELVGEDETRMSQANSSIEGGNALAALVGPALAGVLIPFIGASNVLYVDAATYLVAFLLVLVFVPRRKAIAGTARSGVLAGLRFLASDTLLGPLALTVTAFGFLGCRDVSGPPVLRLRRVRRPLLDRRALLRRARSGRGRRQRARGLRRQEGAAAAARRLRDPGVLDPAVGAPVPSAVAGRVRSAVRSDAVHAARERPDAGRDDLAHAPELRPKVMAAAISANTLAAPLGFLVAGQVLERWGVVPLFTAVVLGITWMAIVFAAITWRHSDGEAVPELVAT